MPLHIFCLEGVHGCGKSTVAKKLKYLLPNRIALLDEAFILQPDQHSFDYTQLLHPQSVTLESKWVIDWFLRAMQLKSQVGSQDVVYIADRSPYTACFYSRNGQGMSLLPMIQSIQRELEQECQIHIHTVCLQVSNLEHLWERVSKRLEREPFRRQYNEHSKEWLCTLAKQYENFPYWDFVLENSYLNEEMAMHSTSPIVQENVHFCAKNQRRQSSTSLIQTELEERSVEQTATQLIQTVLLPCAQ